MKYIIFCFSIALLYKAKPAPESATFEPTQIQWLSWDEAAEASKIMKKKILVDVYTDWCSWCKIMDRETFSDSLVAQYISEHFYAVKLNAEQKETIRWNGQDYQWIASGKNGVHELARELCDGQMSYPTFVFLTENHERIRISKGFKDAAAFYPELVFAAEEHYLKKDNKP